MTTKIRFLRTNTKAARPDPQNPAFIDGVPFLNFNRDEPGLFFKLDDNTICKIGPTYVSKAKRDKEGNVIGPADFPNTNAHAAGDSGNVNGETWLDLTDPERPLFKIFYVDKNTADGSVDEGKWVTPVLLLHKNDGDNESPLKYEVVTDSSGGSDYELRINNSDTSPTAYWVNQPGLTETTTDNTDPENPLVTTTRTIGNYWHSGGKKVGVGNWNPEENSVFDSNTNITTITYSDIPEADLDVKGVVRIESVTTEISDDEGKVGMISVFNGNLQFHNGNEWITIGSSEQTDRTNQSDWLQDDPNDKTFIKRKPTTITPIERDKLNSIAPGAEVNVNADWDATSGDAAILNKPTVITQTERDKLAGIAEGAEVNVKSDWGESDSSNDAYIENKPKLHASDRTMDKLGGFSRVALSGDYEDLSNTPTLPDTPANEATAKKYELNVPASTASDTEPTWTVATAPTSSGGGGLDAVETEGDSLTGDGTSGRPLSVTTPFTPAEKDKLGGLVSHVQSDWNASEADMGAILNKPTLFSERYEDLIGIPNDFVPRFSNNTIDLDYLKSEVTNRLLPSALGTAGQVLQVNSGATGVEYATVASGGGGGSGPFTERYKQDITSLIRNNFSSWFGLSISSNPGGTVDISLPATVSITPNKLYKAELHADFSFSFNFNGVKNMIIYNTEKTINLPQVNVRETRDPPVSGGALSRSDNVKDLIAGRELIASSNSGAVGSLFDFYIRLGFSHHYAEDSLARLQFGQVTSAGKLICSLRPWVKQGNLSTSYSNLVVTSVKVAIYELNL